MDVATTIALLYDKVGRHLGPTIQHGIVKNDSKNIAIKTGICQRTGLSGDIVDYVERQDGDRVTIPTLANLLWIFAKHQIADKTGVFKPSRIGRGRIIVLIDDHVLTNAKFARPIPNILVMESNDILRRVVGRLCLFLAFTDKPMTVLGNGLRWSVGDDLEINGKLTLAGDIFIENASVHLARAMAITQLATKRNAIDLRWLLTLEERSDELQDKLTRLVDTIGLSMEAVITLFNAHEHEMILAYRIWSP